MIPEPARSSCRWRMRSWVGDGYALPYSVLRYNGVAGPAYRPHEFLDAALLETL